ncbi:MAG: outer membrane protein assembly factor BamA, partial [Alphaproteobacteria bacterium]|nr:outer membrane protein assembly factor BamA [Alphaproteobacteria bacterium]
MRTSFGAKHMKIFSKILIILTILYPTFAIAEIVRAIQVTGNNRTEKSSIISYLELKVGQDYSAQKESKSIRDLYETHLFDSINISFSSGIVKVEVKETPLVVKVSSKGNKRIKSGTLAKEITTTKGTSLSKANIKTDIDKIKELYRKSGRYSVSVEAKIVPLENNRAEVIFEIKEGPKTGIKYINFIGNRNYTDSELKSVIISKESAWFRFMDSSDTYDPERFEYDKYLLKRFYNSVGFADFRIISTFPAISKSKDYFSLTFTMEEGAKYTLGTVALQSQIEAIDASLFQKFITIKTGSIYNATLIEQISENINNNLADLGYQGAVTDVSEHKNIDSKKIDLNFIILKASKIHIDKININGNLKTRDNVIRKQLKAQEGSLFNRSAINKAQQNLKDLNYFEHVDLQVAPATNKDKVDVNIEVEEKSTASVHFEIGVDSVQGPIGRVNFVETNLLGTGKHLNVGIEKTDKRTSEHLGITDPYFMDRDLLAGISLHHSDSGKSKQSPYKMSNDSVTTRLGYEIAEDLTHDIIYMLKIDKLKGSPPANSQTGENAISSIYVNEQYGTTTTSAITNSLTYDITDSSLVPKNGYIISGTETVAGLGGDAKYMKHEATLKY